MENASAPGKLVVVTYHWRCACSKKSSRMSLDAQARDVVAQARTRGGQGQGGGGADGGSDCGCVRGNFAQQAIIQKTGCGQQRRRGCTRGIGCHPGTDLGVARAGRNPRARCCTATAAK